MKNYGLKFDEVTDPKAYKFGASPVPMEVLQEDGDWSDSLVVKEFQNLNNVEPYACVIFTILTCVEILIKKQYGEERNYSDRFLATVVGTRGEGCSPHEACEFLRKIGVVPQEAWPFDESIDTEDKFFTKLPPKLYEIAKEFNEEWDFKHEDVAPIPEVINLAIKCSPLLVSFAAWFENGGIYFRPQGMKDNHATTMYAQSIRNFRRVFDSYDSPHIKDLKWDDIPMVIKRFWVKRRKPVQNWFLDLISRFLKIFK